jgi:hypothetical protein
MMTLEQMLDKTSKRQSSFQMMIDHLRTCEEPLIIETGCARPPHKDWGNEDVSFKDEGFSTRIFDAYINLHGGELHSVDINPVHVEYARTQVSELAQVHCSDSVEFLWQANQNLTEQGFFIDLLYLDSYDYEASDPWPCAAHHLKELAAIMSRLRPGSLVAVDDNFIVNGKPEGKGAYLIDFMKSLGKPLIHDGYQLIWKF